MTIYDIARLSHENSPYFFSDDTLQFFGQTMADFEVEPQADGRYKISAPSKDPDGRYMGDTIRYFNPDNNELESE